MIQAKRNRRLPGGLSLRTLIRRPSLLLKHMLDGPLHCLLGFFAEARSFCAGPRAGCTERVAAQARQRFSTGDTGCAADSTGGSGAQYVLESSLGEFEGFVQLGQPLLDLLGRGAHSDQVSNAPGGIFGGANRISGG